LLQATAAFIFWTRAHAPGMPGAGSAAGRCAIPRACRVIRSRCCATFLTLGRRLLDGLQGGASRVRARHARLAAPIRKRHDRLEFLRGELACDDSGHGSPRPIRPMARIRLRAAA
jgi:molybdopterin molybdotransferase